jgi:hypothetical protein
MNISGLEGFFRAPPPPPLFIFNTNPELGKIQAKVIKDFINSLEFFNIGCILKVTIGKKKSID